MDPTVRDLYAALGASNIALREIVLTSLGDNMLAHVRATEKCLSSGIGAAHPNVYAALVQSELVTIRGGPIATHLSAAEQTQLAAFQGPPIVPVPGDQGAIAAAADLAALSGEGADDATGGGVSRGMRDEERYPRQRCSAKCAQSRSPRRQRQRQSGLA